ncbi:protein turtle [Dermatophagoides farinae]|uniref:Protein turtle n=1 Tax=Dermatophagoides farinae TaxID=6954 RepID=A0A9D4NW44_DERFA|nr:protein turtle [Dermatophagoides farinae]
MTMTTEPYHTTANLGENVILRCVFDFPEGFRVPYVIQWEKKGVKIPIYIWYDGYHPHIGEGYENRVSLSGRASLNLTNVRDTDQGWYECKVFFLNRPPEPIKNGTWVHLDVLAPPQFRVKPPDVIYVKVGESVTLPCEAYGTPTPQITWYKDNKPLKANSNIQIYNHELQIDNIQLSDIGEYRCTSRNREGSINAITKIIIAGPAVITLPPPRNTTKLQGDRVELVCEARALPSNVTYRWFHDGQEIGHVPWQESRFVIKPGMLVINPSVAEDSGHYTCEVSNGIGSPDTASAYLNIEFPARVYYSPTIQYLPLGLSGIIRCFIQASPSFQFVTWTKDRRPFDPNATPDVSTINNGSLLFHKVSLEHQGIYRCTPYNVHGTAESSQPMEVLVRDPPVFTRKPKDQYVRAVNDEVSISCDGTGQPKPNIYWRKADGTKLSPRERTTIRSGNITIKLLKKEDHGRYECVLENEIVAISVPTLLIINNTTPHTPTNVSVNTSYFAATIQWEPNYNGGYEQTFHLSYRISDQGDAEWKTIRVPPPETTNTFTLYNLQSDNEYEFQVYATNRLGAGQPSPIIRASTKPWSFGEKIYPTDASGATYIPTVQKPSGPKPDAPRNLTFQRMAQGWVLSWHPPLNITVAVAYYRVEYRRDDDSWMYTDPIPYDTAYLFEKLESNSHYIFRVWAYSILGVGEVSPMIEVNIEDYDHNDSQLHFRAMIASIIGGFIFFSMSIVLILCMVKVCNKKKRRKIEKSYVMVTCPVNGNACYNDNSMPSKQQFEMFDPNSQATSDFMINLSMPIGSMG